jgi:hypothetical protein
VYIYLHCAHTVCPVVCTALDLILSDLISAGDIYSVQTQTQTRANARVWYAMLCYGTTPTNISLQNAKPYWTATTDKTRYRTLEDAVDG